MADISYMQKEDHEDSDKAMKAEGGGDGGGGGGGGGEEWNGSGDEAEKNGGQIEHIYQLAKLQHHANSDTSFTRQMVGRILVESFRSAVNTETKLPVEEYMKCVHKISDDPEIAIRLDLVDQLPYAAMIVREAPHLFGDVLHNGILSIIKKFLLDVDSQVRQSAQEALLVLIKHGMLETKIIENEICPIVEELSRMTVEYLNSGISLMSKMALLIGKELTEKVFLDRYIALCEDNIFHVRRMCVLHFGEMCTAVGKKALLQKLFPVFVQLCLDRVWGVRKACVDVMMPVSCCVSFPYRQILLADILATHLNDDSKWVRTSAFQILGPFISTFAKQFTNVTYNQDGELVFTSQQQQQQQDENFNADKNNSGTERDLTSSIRYSYEGMFPTKCAIRNQTFDSEDYDIRDVLDINCLKEVYEQSQKNSMFNYPIKAHKMKTQKKQMTENEQSEADEVDKFNTFLYYYIPPEIPLDDPLVLAAKKSSENSKAANNNNNNNNTNVENKKDDNNTADATNSSTIDTRKEECSDKCSSSIVDNRTSNQTNKEEDDEKDDENDNNRPTTWSDDSADTIDISNLSLDRSNVNGPAFDNKSYVNFMLRRKYASKKNQNIVPQDLVDYFVSMAEPELCEEGEIPYHCAFSFPAVAFTLGKANWPYLRKAYQSLAGAKQWKVRRTLASSIHEIAIILGEEITASDLVPIYDGFIKDLDEVRIGVLKHLATFLKILKPTYRWHYLPGLHNFLVTDNEWNWRFRKEFATQLLEVVTLFNANDVAKHIAPLSLKLLVDKVAAVRQIALTLVTRIVSHLSTDEPLAMALIQELKETLAMNTNKWVLRQTYALLCAQLIVGGAISGEKFTKEMLPSLLNLSWDNVPNVRLAVARTLSQNVITMGIDWLGSEYVTVEGRLQRMRSDIDRDVRFLAEIEEHHLVVPDVQMEQARNIVF